MTLKDWLTVIVATPVIFGIVFTISNGETEQEKADKQHQALIDDKTNQIRQSIADYFKSEKEPTIIDAVWTSDYMFKIGVHDDGTNRDGLASYVCEHLNDDYFDQPDHSVQVVDIGVLQRSQKWVKLGEQHCNLQ